jgi:hypothetical protein
MPTRAENKRRKAQSSKDKTRNRRRADHRLDRIYAGLFKNAQITQKAGPTKEEVYPTMPVRFLSFPFG